MTTALENETSLPDFQKLTENELKVLCAAQARRIQELEAMDRAAATHVESVLAMRTAFTGELPYVGWKGLGLALNESLDERDDYKKTLLQVKDFLAPRAVDCTPADPGSAYEMVVKVLRSYAKKSVPA